MTTRNLKAWGVAFFSAIAVAAPAGVLYDNTTTQTGNILNFQNGQEIGDEIFLANYATFPYLTNFSFEYYSPDMTFSGTVQADVRFYLNDGATYNGYNSPSTLFYESGLFTLLTPQSYFPGTNSAVLDFSLSDLQGGTTPLNPNFQMPSNFTMSVTFSGLSGTDSVGLNVFEPPTVGTNYGDYWMNNGGWSLLTLTNTPVAFAAQFNGTTQPTPEPGTLSLIALGAVVLACSTRRRRQ